MIQLYQNLKQKIGRSKNDLSSGQYSDSKNIRFKTSILRSNLCDYSDAHIVVKRRISVTDNENANRRNKKLTFKNNAPFRSCMSKSITHS